MKQKIWLNCIIILLFLFIQACSNYSEDCYINDSSSYISMGLIETNTADEYNFEIYCDNGDTLLPVKNEVSDFEIYNEQRIIAYYTILYADSLNNCYYVCINSLYEVLYKDIIELTSSNDDSLGNDPINITDIWIVKNMLNFEFEYKGNDKNHNINLCYSTNEYGIITTPVELEFRHNANNDEELLTFNGIVSFKLDMLTNTIGNAIDNENDSSQSINFTIKTINYQKEEVSFTCTYSEE